MSTHSLVLVIAGAVVPIAALIAALSIWQRARRRLTEEQKRKMADAFSNAGRFGAVLPIAFTSMYLLGPAAGAIAGALILAGVTVWSVRKLRQIEVPQPFLRSHLVATSVGILGLGAYGAFLAYWIGQQTILS